MTTEGERLIRSGVVDLVDAIDIGEAVEALDRRTAALRAEARAVVDGSAPAHHFDPEYADAPDVVEPHPGEPNEPRSGPRLRGLLAGVAAALALVSGLVFFSGLGPQVATDAPDTVHPTFPEELPPYRVGRTSQTSEPLTDVAVSYNFRPDHDFGALDAPHQVLLGADLSSTRHFDISDSPETMVSPDGHRLASMTGANSVRLDDLRAGTQVGVELPTEQPEDRTELVEWSQDGSRVYAGTADQGTAGFAGKRWWEIDLAGKRHELAWARGVRALSAAPGSLRFAVVRADGRVDVVDRSGRVLSSPVGPSGPSIQSRLEASSGEPTSSFPRPAPGSPHAPVTVVWSPSGRVLLTLERQAPALVEPGIERYWQGTIARIVDVAEGTAGSPRELRLENYHCRPLAMLSETSVLCESTVATAPVEEWWQAPSGMTTLDLRTGARRVVARFPQIDNGVWWTYVAADLARTWRFSLSAPWVDPGRERG